MTKIETNSTENLGEHVDILKGFLAAESNPVEVWNMWREKNDIKNPQLQGMKIENAQLANINLMRADLSNSDLSHANLEKANLLAATLHSANLAGADFSNSNLSVVEAYKADCWSTDFHNADLRGADFSGAHFRDARFHGAYLSNSNFDQTNLHITQGITLDHTSIKGALFDPDSSDPWSILRRSYTGSMVFFHLMFSFLFFTPFVAKTLLWASVSSYQKFIKNPDLLICASNQCTDTKVWKLMLGFHDGWLFLSVIAVLVYNLVRLYLTFHVSRMKDAEERSGRSPLWEADGLSRFMLGSELDENQCWYKIIGILTWLRGWPNGYRPLYKIHRLANVLLVVAFLVSIYNLYYWLNMPIQIPQ